MTETKATNEFKPDSLGNPIGNLNQQSRANTMGVLVSNSKIGILSSLPGDSN